MNNERFDPESIKGKSIAAMSVAMWVKAMDVYSDVLKIVTPLRAELAKAEAEKAEAKIRYLRAARKETRSGPMEPASMLSSAILDLQAANHTSAQTAYDGLSEALLFEPQPLVLPPPLAVENEPWKE